MVVQKIVSHDTVQSLEISQRTLNIHEDNFVENTTFYKTYFHLDGSVNKIKLRIFDEEKRRRNALDASA